MKNKLFTLAAALALTAVIGGFYSAPVLAAVVKAALVQSVDEPGRQPYMTHFVASNGPLTFATTPVPAGKRLVLQYVNVFATTTAPSYFYMNVNGGAGYYTFAMSPSIKSSLSAPISGYLDPGQYLNGYTEGSAGHIASEGVIAGYLVDCNATSPCTAIAQ